MPLAYGLIVEQNCAMMTIASALSREEGSTFRHVSDFGGALVDAWCSIDEHGKKVAVLHLHAGGELRRPAYQMWDMVRAHPNYIRDRDAETFNEYADVFFTPPPRLIDAMDSAMWKFPEARSVLSNPPTQAERWRIGIARFERMLLKVLESRGTNHLAKAIHDSNCGEFKFELGLMEDDALSASDALAAALGSCLHRTENGEAN
jgi:hypothetical protein